MSTLTRSTVIGGRTALTESLGWKNAPKPIQIALDSGKEKLTEVLGESTEEVPGVSASEEDGFLEAFNALGEDQASRVKKMICTP